MRQASRRAPTRLAEKLTHIRLVLEFSQSELIKRLGLEDELRHARASAYERGVREPPLLVLLSYARVTGVYVDVLIDDDLELPCRDRITRNNSSTSRRAAWRNFESQKP